MRTFARLLAAACLMFVFCPLARSDTFLTWEASSAWQVVGLPGSAYVPTRIEELAPLLGSAPRSCLVQGREVLSLLGNYGDAVARSARVREPNAPVPSFPRELGGVQRTLQITDPCRKTRFRAYVLGTLFLMIPENYDPSYPGIIDSQGRKLPSDLSLVFLAAELLDRGWIRSWAPEAGEEEWGGVFSCKTHWIGVDPSLPPYRFGAVLLHELRHLATDMSPAFYDFYDPVNPKAASSSAKVDSWRAILLAEEAAASLEQILRFRSLRSYDRKSRPSDPMAGVYLSAGDIDPPLPGSLTTEILALASAGGLTAGSTFLDLTNRAPESGDRELALRFYERIWIDYFRSLPFSSVNLNLLTEASHLLHPQDGRSPLAGSGPLLEESEPRGFGGMGPDSWIEILVRGPGGAPVIKKFRVRLAEQLSLPFSTQTLAPPRALPLRGRAQGEGCRGFLDLMRSQHLPGYLRLHRRDVKPGNGGVKGGHPEVRACLRLLD